MTLLAPEFKTSLNARPLSLLNATVGKYIESIAFIAEVWKQDSQRRPQSLTNG